jgi:uncharacterized phiE125 gp8 family phage protein
MPLAYKELSQPAAEPVSLSEAKDQLVLDDSFDQDDLLITGLIVAARQHVEKVMQRSIFNRQMVLSLDYFPLASECVNGADQYAYVSSYIRSLSILVPKPGLVSVQSITYLSDNNQMVTMDPATYVLDPISEPGRIMPAPGTYWPYQNQYIPGQVRVNYTSGTYGDGIETDNCPMSIKLAILLLVSHFYDHRSATTEASLTNIPLGVAELLSGESFETVY